VSELCRLDGVRVSAGERTILDVRTLGVEEGEILVVLGPTGAGKSTLLRVLAFLQRPSAGAVAWRGLPAPWPLPLPLRRRIAMAFQDPLLFAGTVADNVAWGLRVRGVRGGALAGRRDEVLQLLRVDHLAGRRADRLSGGEAQRVALARALVVRPDLLLLDEPLASLDPPIREALREELAQIVRAQAATCVFVTHDQDEALAIADRIVVLHEGRPQQVGTPDDVFFRPANELVARFVQTTNVLPAQVAESDAGGSVLDLARARVRAAAPAPAGARVLVCLRPEEIGVERLPGSAAAPGMNRLEGVVTAVVARGATVTVVIDCGVPLTARLTRRTAGRLALAPGDPVAARFEPSALHVIEAGGDAAPVA
jgi:ABC-type sugar transport system ATPase subunit